MQLSKVNNVDVKIVALEQTNTCDNATVANRLSTKPSIVDGAINIVNNKRILVRCNSCVYNDDLQHKQAQANTFAMVMKQDCTSTTIWTVQI